MVLKYAIIYFEIINCIYVPSFINIPYDAYNNIILNTNKTK